MRKHNDKADERYVPFKITAVDKDGEPLAAALDGKYKNRNFPLKSSRRLPAPAVGDEFLGKLQKTAGGTRRQTDRPRRKQNSEKR